MAKEKIDEKINTNENGEVTVNVTPEQLEILKNIEAEKEKLAKEKADVEARQKEISERELAQESKKTAKELKNTQKMVQITIPVSELNPHDTVVPVCINGYLWQIKRGEEVTVPEEVKNILKEAKYI
jgi:predicted DNA binding CopG/RHH family protein